MDNSSNLNSNFDGTAPENSNSSEKKPQDKFPSANLTANIILIAGGVVFGFGAYYFFSWLLGS